MLIPTRVLPSLTVLALGVAVAAMKSPQAASSLQPGENPPAIIFVEAPKVVPGELTRRFPQGSRLMRLAQAAPASSPANLTPEFFAVADPRVSANGTKILFSGQKTPGDH